MDLERHGTTHPFQVTVDDLEGVKVLESFGDLQQLERSVRERTVYQVEANTHQFRSRGIGTILQILYDIPVIVPVVDENQLGHRRVCGMKREDVLVNQSLPDG